MAEMTQPKTALHTSLRESREALLWKLEGLTEREARLPRTPTGNNLLGVVKHCLNVEAGYFGPTFGRAFPDEDALVSDADLDADPQSDWYAREDETKDGIVDLYRRVQAFADETIEQLPLDAVGRVPWWPADRQEVTLDRVLVRVLTDVARHAGHADVMREAHDGAVGLMRDNTNVAAGYDWPAYVDKLTGIAQRFH
jgi:hypothetical protein